MARSLISVPSFELPEWTVEMHQAWDGHSHLAADLSRGAGTGRNFGALVEEARALLLAGDVHALDQRISDCRFVRAVGTAWLEDVSLARATMSVIQIARITARGRLSRLTTITFATLFFSHFDRLEQWHDGLFAAAADVVRSAVREQRVRASGDLVETIRKHDDFFFQPDGPIQLAVSLLSTGDDVASWMRMNHLSAQADSRWGRIARDAFYLASIEAADAEQGDHAFLEAVTSEVLARQRTDASDAEGLYFGHQVLSALTAKHTQRPSTAWLEATLAYAGDPRHSQTPTWLRWWSKVPSEHLRRAIRWMRGVDLRAFLDGVEQYAADTDNTAMTRMLEARKRLLLGLYEQDRVEDVRLILGDDIRRWIRRSSRLNYTMEEARLRDSGKQDTAVIYVDCGDFCLVEGSHNFKLHIYAGGPLEGLANRAVRSFTGSELRDTLPYRHMQVHGPDAHFAVAHQGGEWIRTSLDFLRRKGITLDERGLMTANDYADLSRRRAAAWY